MIYFFDTSWSYCSPVEMHSLFLQAAVLGTKLLYQASPEIFFWKVCGGFLKWGYPKASKIKPIND